MNLNKLKVGDLIQEDLANHTCPECEGEISVDQDRDKIYYHCDDCGWGVDVQIQHVIASIESGCDHTTTDMSGGCTHCGKSAAEQLNDRGLLEYEDCPFCHCERKKGEMCHNGCKPAAFN